MEEAHTSPFSCADCKKAHRKCDRILPACSYCARKSKECIYKPPVTPKRSQYKPYPTRTNAVFKDVTAKYMEAPQQQKKEKIINSRQVASLPSKIEDDVVRLFLVRQHTELSWERLFVFMPIIDPKRIHNILEYIRDYVSTGREESPEYFVPRKSELALVFAVEASCFTRAGDKAISKQLYEKARLLLYPIFDEVECNYEVASCYQYLALWNTYNGDLIRANFYLKNCSKFLENLDQQQSNINTNFLRYSIRVIETLADDKATLWQIFLLLTEMHGLYGRFRALQDSSIFMDSNTPLSNTPILGLESIDILVRELSAIIDKNFGLLPTANLEIKRLQYLIIAQAVKLLCIKNAGILPDITTLNIANSIANMTKSQYFPLCSSFTAPALIEAANVHMKFLLDGFNQTLVSQLKQEYLALKILSDRYDLVMIRYGNFIQGIEQIIRMYEAQQKLQRTVQQEIFTTLNQTDPFCTNNVPN